MSGFLSPTATSSGRRLKRLDKTASLVGLKYAFISDCRWSRISEIESPLHSCWDKITVKNRRGGSLAQEGGVGVPEPLEPSPGYAPATRQFTLSCGQGFSPVAYDSFYSTKAITRGHVPINSFGDKIIL